LSTVAPATLVTSEDRVLVLAPTGRDAALISRMLGKDKLCCHECGTVDEMSLELGNGAGIAVFAEEALIGVTLQPLLAALRQQPPWSDFPLVFLTSTGSEASETSIRLLDLFGPEANITLLERPIRVATLLSSVRSALRARRRQYEVRNYLEERKRSDEKLLRTQKLESLGVLAGGVAHDFNNLLTGIMGNASLAVDHLPPGCESIRPILDDIVAASERAGDLTKQLLAYAGKGRFVIAPLNLSSLVRDISHLVKSTLPKNVELHLELSDDLPCIEADASQMQQVVMNLLINAAESIPEGLKGDVIAVTSAKNIDDKGARQPFTAGEVTPGRYVVLEVHDTGAGMDQATRELIFDPFFTTKFTGRGLGLAAVLGIVQGHKGALKVQSTPGQGSTFKVLFPVADAVCPVSPPKTAMAPASTKRGKTILVIDDEPTVRRTAKSTLERGGYDTILAEDGKEGLDIFRALEAKIAAVLLDLTMPGMNGEEVLRHLKEIRPDVKVILSSGFSEVEVIPKFSGKGLAGFVQKPYTASALTTKLAEVVGQVPELPGANPDRRSL
jgi:signal transduction histidine kinase/ActR/RegA family two-component response regulator